MASKVFGALAGLPAPTSTPSPLFGIGSNGALPAPTSGPLGTPGIGGSYGPGAPTTAYRPNVSKGLRAHVSIPYHYVVLPDVSGSARDVSQSLQDSSQLNLGQIVFARNIDGAPPNTRERFNNGSVVALSPQATQFMNVGQLNRWLAQRPGRYASATELLHEWRLTGSLKNEVAPSYGHYGAKPNTRMVNLIVGHRVSTMNVFSKNLIEGEQLGFIVREATSDDGVVGSKRSRTDKQRIFTIVPWVGSTKPRPNVRELKPPGAETCGKFVFLGTVSKSVRNGPASSTAALTFLTSGEVSAQVLNNVEVFVGV